jgi:hypothetical protein
VTDSKIAYAVVEQVDGNFRLKVVDEHGIAPRSHEPIAFDLLTNRDAGHSLCGICRAPLSHDPIANVVAIMNFGDAYTVAVLCTGCAGRDEAEIVAALTSTLLRAFGQLDS